VGNREADAELVETIERVRDEPTRADLRAWVPRLLEHEDARGERRLLSDQEECRRSSGRSAADDDHVTPLHGRER